MRRKARQTRRDRKQDKKRTRKNTRLIRRIDLIENPPKYRHRIIPNTTPLQLQQVPVIIKANNENDDVRTLITKILDLFRRQSSLNITGKRMMI